MRIKKTILLFCLICASQVYAVPPERYVRSVEKISNTYNTDMRQFLRSLNPQQTEFDVQQHAQFCAIVDRYVQDLYVVNDKYRQDLPFSYAKLTKQDLIQQVWSSPEMQILQKYNIHCNLQ